MHSTERILEKMRFLEYQLNEIHNMVSMLVGTATMQRRTEHKIMANIQELQAKADETLNQVRAETSVLDSVKTYVQAQNDQLASLQQQVEDLISSGSTSSEDLQKLSDTLDQIRSSNESNTQALAAAIVKDTPAEGTDPSVPTDTGTDTGTGTTDENGNPVENNTTGGGTPVSTDEPTDTMSRRRR